MATSTRQWLRPPQLRTLDADQGERHATWLELFFDLVFVISIAEVAHTLEDYRAPADFLGTAGLFVAVWWAWVGYTVYADRFDTDDLVHRVLVLAELIGIERRPAGQRLHDPAGQEDRAHGQAERSGEHRGAPPADPGPERRVLPGVRPHLLVPVGLRSDLVGVLGLR